jgi:hypothetical protein
MQAVIAQVVAALICVESGGRADAVGDGGRAAGILQMWPVAVAEANRVEAIVARREGRPARKWGPKDRLNPAASQEMCAVLLRWHYRRGVTDPVALGCRWRNPGGDAPGWYARKVRDALDKKKG